MYVLCCPCIADPSLRANGITTKEDIEAFRRCITRCRRAGIEIRLLPCLESIYLGLNRDPGPFAGRFDKYDFHRLMIEQARSVKKLIKQEGRPELIIGVDSSPLCGVNTSYYTKDKRTGRGEFLAMFPDIPAVDVYEFAADRIYFAAPLFSTLEQEYNVRMRAMLERYSYSVYLPQDTGDDNNSREKSINKRIFSQNINELESASLVVAIINGADADSGVAFEIGYAYARGIPIIAVRTDFRQVGRSELVNLMLEQASVVVRSEDELIKALPCPLDQF